LTLLLRALGQAQNVLKGACASPDATARPKRATS
jgi:hypothetical protein